MANLDDIAGVLRAAGVTVHETPGWDTRGYAGQDLKAVRGVLWHHTATNRIQFAGNAAPTLSMCINGRSDLPGPLCNLVFDRNGEIWVVATGVANHAGEGSAPGIPKDMGNHYLIGIEAESSGVAPWDWTPAQLHWAPIIGAALERHYLGWMPDAERLQLGHMEYSSQGKIDPAGWPGGMDGLRTSINAALQGSSINPQGTITQEDELSQAQYETLLAEIKASRTVDQQIEDVTRAMIEKVAASVWAYTNPTLGGGDAYQILRDAVANTNKLAADVAKVAAKAATGGATEAQITEAVKKAISESIVNVDVTVGGAK